MEIELKDRKVGTKFGDLDKGDVFILNGGTACYVKTEYIYGYQDNDVNAISLTNGDAHCFDDWTPVTRIKGKFIEEE